LFSGFSRQSQGASRTTPSIMLAPHKRAIVGTSAGFGIESHFADNHCLEIASHVRLVGIAGSSRNLGPANVRCLFYQPQRSLKAL
jgi:hypothetical protein